MLQLSFFIILTFYVIIIIYQIRVFLMWQKWAAFQHKESSLLIFLCLLALGTGEQSQQH